jgi:hypothetical protein
MEETLVTKFTDISRVATRCLCWLLVGNQEWLELRWEEKQISNGRSVWDAMHDTTLKQ